MKKVPFHISIRGFHFQHANYALIRETDTEVAAVERSLSRTSGGAIWGLHQRGYEMDRANRVTAIICNGTLTRRQKIAGAYPVLAEFTVRIAPISREN